MTDSPQGLVLVAVAVLLVLVALLPRAEVRHPLVSLVRVLVPSWRFFDDLQVTPTLLVRVAPDGAPFGAWRPVLAPPPRSVVHLVWNPAGNLLLAQQSLLERLLMDVAEWDDGDPRGPETLVSYQLVLNLVRARIAADGDVPRGATCQFKLVETSHAAGAASDRTPGSAPGDLVISREHEA